MKPPDGDGNANPSLSDRKIVTASVSRIADENMTRRRDESDFGGPNDLVAVE